VLPGGRKGEAIAINERGQIVGRSTTKTGQTHAVLWTLKRDSYHGGLHVCPCETCNRRKGATI
jgi:uncharacterized membrane protein